jgi:hypothetical protein
MVDSVVLLTPLLALAIVLLLGFAGCKFEHGRLLPSLRFRARVPSTLTVTEVVFTFTVDPPGGASTTQVLTNPMAVGTDGADSLYEYVLSSANYGQWATSCLVKVQEGSAKASGLAMGDFKLDDTFTDPVATFQASGAPSTGFGVNYVGVS